MSKKPSIETVPHRSARVTYDPPITLLELALRLHRPGDGDARVRYEIEIHSSITCDADPEKAAAQPENIRFASRVSIEERGQGTSVVRLSPVGTATLNDDGHIIRVEALGSALHYNAERLLLLASTPLADPK